MNDFAIPTFVINLKKRTDRKKNVIKEFSGRSEFRMTIVEAEDNTVGAIGLWNTIQHIIANLVNDQDEFILICEDDHKFTKDYSKEYLFNGIAAAMERDADLLSGGISWFASTIELAPNLFWVEDFSGLQFTVLFRKFFNEILSGILNEPFDERILADVAYSRMTSNKMVLYPFISLQKDFGHSDVTEIHNKKPGLVQRMFDHSIKRFHAIQNVHQRYAGMNNTGKIVSGYRQNVHSL